MNESTTKSCIVKVTSRSNLLLCHHKNDVTNIKIGDLCNRQHRSKTLKAHLVVARRYYILQGERLKPVLGRKLGTNVKLVKGLAAKLAPTCSLIRGRGSF